MNREIRIQSTSFVTLAMKIHSRRMVLMLAVTTLWLDVTMRATFSYDPQHDKLAWFDHFRCDSFCHSHPKLLPAAWRHEVSAFLEQIKQKRDRLDVPRQFEQCHEVL